MARRCERIVVEVDRVYDACMVKGEETFVVRLSDIEPEAVPPYNFLDMRRTGAAVLSHIDARQCENGKSKINCVVNIPVRCDFCDAVGRRSFGYGTITERREVCLCMPENGVLKVEANVKSLNGAFINDEVVAETYCVEEIFKVVGREDVVINTACAEFPECRGQCPR